MKINVIGIYYQYFVPENRFLKEFKEGLIRNKLFKYFDVSIILYFFNWRAHFPRYRGLEIFSYVHVFKIKMIMLEVMKIIFFKHNIGQ